MTEYKSVPISMGPGVANSLIFFPKIADKKTIKRYQSAI